MEPPLRLYTSEVLMCRGVFGLVPLRGEKNSSHAHKTGSWYLLGLLMSTPDLIHESSPGGLKQARL